MLLNGASATEFNSFKPRKKATLLFLIPCLRPINLILYSEVAHGFQAQCLFVVLGAPIQSLVLYLIYCGLFGNSQ